MAKYKSERSYDVLAIAFVINTEYGPTLYASNMIERANLILKHSGLPAEYKKFANSPVVVSAVMMEPIQVPAKADNWEFDDSAGLYLPGTFYSGTKTPKDDAAIRAALAQPRIGLPPPGVGGSIRAGNAKRLLNEQKLLAGQQTIDTNDQGIDPVDHEPGGTQENE